MMVDPRDEASTAWLGFCSAMKKWNDKFYPLMKENAAAFVDAAIIELEPIFQQYVCPKAVRGDERLNNPTTSNPSDYNPDSDIIEDIGSGKTKTIIYAQSKTGFQDRFRYTMLRRGAEWKLSKREVYNDVLEKWKSHHI
jgi:hypothetical protein